MVPRRQAAPLQIAFFVNARTSSGRSMVKEFAFTKTRLIQLRLATANLSYVPDNATRLELISRRDPIPQDDPRHWRTHLILVLRKAENPVKNSKDFRSY